MLKVINFDIRNKKGDRLLFIAVCPFNVNKEDVLLFYALHP